MSSMVLLEGGDVESSESLGRCREGFRRLLEKCGFSGRMPRLKACGSRQSAYENFVAIYASQSSLDYIALLIDSEDPVANIDETWRHLNQRDGWQTPPGAQDDQVLFMVTCMETWIVTDLQALNQHFGNPLQTSALPPMNKLEDRSRQDVQDRPGARDSQLPQPLHEGTKIIRDTRQAQPGRTGVAPPQLPPRAPHPERQTELGQRPQACPSLGGDAANLPPCPFVSFVDKNSP